jgi:hypothetical protein
MRSPGAYTVCGAPAHPTPLAHSPPCFLTKLTPSNPLLTPRRMLHAAPYPFCLPTPVCRITQLLYAASSLLLNCPADRMGCAGPSPPPGRRGLHIRTQRGRSAGRCGLHGATDGVVSAGTAHRAPHAARAGSSGGT